MKRIASRPTSQMTSRPSWRSIARSARSASSGTNATGARRPCVRKWGNCAARSAPKRPPGPSFQTMCSRSELATGHWARSSTTSTGGESGSSRTPITRTVLCPNESRALHDTVCQAREGELHGLGDPKRLPRRTSTPSPRRCLPAGAAVVPRVVRDAMLLGSVRLHRVDLGVADTLAIEGDLRPVR
jgi:hypothetical protein